MENPIKMDDMGVPLFLETPKSPIKTGLFLIATSLLRSKQPGAEGSEKGGREWKKDRIFFAKVNR